MFTTTVYPQYVILHNVSHLHRHLRVWTTWFNEKSNQCFKNGQCPVSFSPSFSHLKDIVENLPTAALTSVPQPLQPFLNFSQPNFRLVTNVTRWPQQLRQCSRTNRRWTRFARKKDLPVGLLTSQNNFRLKIVIPLTVKAWLRFQFNSICQQSIIVRLNP